MPLTPAPPPTRGRREAVGSAPLRRLVRDVGGRAARYLTDGGVSGRLGSVGRSAAWQVAAGSAPSGSGQRARGSSACWSCSPTGWWRWALSRRCCCDSSPCPTAATRRGASVGSCPPGQLGCCRSCPRSSSRSRWPPASPSGGCPTPSCWAASSCTTCTGAGGQGGSPGCCALSDLGGTERGSNTGTHISFSDPARKADTIFHLPTSTSLLYIQWILARPKLKHLCRVPFRLVKASLFHCRLGRSTVCALKMENVRYKGITSEEGFMGWLIGMAINIHSDHILRNLRKPGETGYKIPRGGMFEYVSGANFFGEILEWFGFALACCTTESLAFALCTLFILGSRAKQHHQWYLEKFEDYPKNRKIVIPFVY
ncbi:3-oxo-5-alpha-steroid 4-dehydrogenase 1 isoform X3 [Gallus gallus]|uniref:3-oxo-5-alpha-steroid 4-dehydrogenase 1 isoform X3 n=1 Tax=Gallus gallus TaxID=9031 RepID=UPI001F00822E|nr:3-oxo-5-alpha-steroid 4-dehydrogenase 1 isoform X3 [Gallus gallus]